MDNHSPVAFIDLLSNSLVLHQICPYLPISALVALLKTSKDIKDLLLFSAEPWKYLSLSTVKSAVLPYVPVDSGGINWRSQRMDENLTEDEFYSGPIRGIFSKLRRRNIIPNVQILVLDGLSVPADLVSEILSDDQLSLRILSIRGVTHLNERKLQQLLQYAVRPGRREGTPKLRGLYFFGHKELLEPGLDRSAKPQTQSSTNLNQMGVTESEGAQIGATWNAKSQDALTSSLGGCKEAWYRKSGKILKRNPGAEWADTIKACEGIIAFDAILCRGPRHDIANFSTAKDEETVTKPYSAYLRPAVANVALGPRGCESCHSVSEGPAVWGESPSHYLPLLSPPPLHSSSVRAAQKPPIVMPSNVIPPLIVRCEECLRDRYCERCFSFWDEDCYADPIVSRRLPSKIGVSRDCFGCGKTCVHCHDKYIRRCGRCRHEYCVSHQEGEGKFCDWCSRRGQLRRYRELY